MVRCSVDPFAPCPLQALQRYYESICHHRTVPTLGLVGAPLAPSGHTGIGGFSCSVTKPLVRSCRLYAGSDAGNHLQFGNPALVPKV